jgi:hypothetical protein
MIDRVTGKAPESQVRPGAAHPPRPRVRLSPGRHWLYQTERAGHFGEMQHFRQLLAAAIAAHVAAFQVIMKVNSAWFEWFLVD